MSRCIRVMGALAAITASPRAHYVNVHTPLWPSGEVRGQLKK